MASDGYCMYDNRIIITFGGHTSNNIAIDDIYYIDLFGDKGWKKSVIKCANK